MSKELSSLFHPRHGTCFFTSKSINIWPCSTRIPCSCILCAKVGFEKNTYWAVSFFISFQATKDEVLCNPFLFPGSGRRLWGHHGRRPERGIKFELIRIFYLSVRCGSGSEYCCDSILKRFLSWPSFGFFCKLGPPEIGPHCANLQTWEIRSRG